MLSVSILDIKTDEKLKKLDELDFDYIHVDVMDNKFVPNITKDFEKLKKQFQNIKHPLDIHLMTYDLISYIDTYKELNPKYITFHVEASAKLTVPSLIVTACPVAVSSVSSTAKSAFLVITREPCSALVAADVKEPSTTMEPVPKEMGLAR